MFLTSISLKRPVFAFVVIIALIAVGITSFINLGMNDMPETNIPYIMINVGLPGASPDQVESKVTKKVEEAVGQISGVKHITSSINEGSSMTTVEFNDTRTVESAAQDVRTKIDSIRGSLPSDVDEPVISKFDMDAMPIVSLAVTGDLSTRDMANLINDTIVPELNTVTGVGSITAYGSQDREIQIKLDKEKLAAYNLTTDQIVASLKSDNIDSPSGKVSGSSREITLRTYGSIKKVDDFNNILITTLNGVEVRVRDVAEVVDGYEDRSSVSYWNSKECVGVDIVKQSGTNTVTVADSIKKKLNQIQTTLPSGVKIEIVDDNSSDIRTSVSNVEETMLEGCLLAVLVIFLFLRGLGSTAISAVSLPTSIITTFAALKFMNFTINNMTLLALSLSVGLLIDDAIVVIENIVRHLHMGKTPFEAAKEATSEISLAVMATTFTIVAVFLPMSTMGGMLGSFFKEFGLTIAFSVIVSLFVSFTLVPLLASRYLKHEEEKPIKGRFGKFLVWFNLQFEYLAGYYRKLLEWVLSNRKKTILITGVLFLLSLATIPQMSMSFQPTEDMGKVNVTANLDAGMTLDAALQKTKDIEEIVNKYSNIKGIYTTVTADKISVGVKLTDKKNRKESAEEIANEMRAELQKIPGIDLSVTGASKSLSNASKNYTLHIQGEDFNQLLAYSQQARQLLARIPGAVDVGISYKAGKPEARMVVDRDASADLGVSPTSVSSTLGTLFNGIVVGQYEVGNDRYDVRVRLADEQRRDLDSFYGIYVSSTNSGTGMVSLDQLTKKVYTTSSSTINRYDKSREVQVQANYVGMTSSDLDSAFMSKLNTELKPPKGISFGMGGDQASMQESMMGLVQALLLGILFIFLILAAQFESWLDPLAIMFALPLAIIGAMIALFVSGAGLTMVGGIGIIFLLGLVTKNAILLVDFIKQRRHQGIGRREAILEAGLTRLRPILMTTLAMIAGMLPSALALSTGSELRQPMAIAIIGGLISSTLLTLLVIPVIYTILDDVKNLLKRRQVRQQAASDESCV
ncbi:MAG: efflux RND transporter permease subunit [Syntrophomonas sp.]